MNCKYPPKFGFIPLILWDQVPYGNFKSIMGFLFFRGTRSRLTPLFKFQAYWWLNGITVTNEMHYCGVFWFAINDFIQTHFLKVFKPFMLLNENHSIGVIDCPLSWRLFLHLDNFREEFIFANAKFRDNKNLTKWQNHSVVYWYR